MGSIHTDRQIILGITNNDDASAALVIDGSVAAAVQEERFSRIKLDNTWPRRSIAHVLQRFELNLGDVSGIAYGWSTGFPWQDVLVPCLDRCNETANDPKRWMSFRKRIVDEIENDKEKRTEFDDFVSVTGFEGDVHRIDHHECHGMGAFLCSPFEEAIVVTADGRGDFQSLTISHCTANHRSVLHRELTHDSLGYFYGRITHLLGFEPNKHEGKVTGLAAHGDPNICADLMKKMIKLEPEGIRANLGEWFVPSYHGYSDGLIEEVNKYDRSDVAAAAQAHLEQIVCSLLERFLPKDRGIAVCLAGGVFGNVRLNQKVRELAGVCNVFVLPFMGDGGLSLAAAVTASHKSNGHRPKLSTVALGPNHDPDTIHTPMLVGDDLQIDASDVVPGIQTLLLDNQVIGLIRGQMEFGPRALCKRSLIYHAKDAKVNEWLNGRLNRTEFMPFAPVVAENLAEQCFLGWDASQECAWYMTMTYDCTDLIKELCPAVVHVDGTARPQVVTKAGDPLMYNLLNEWYEKTGEPCLINTSFNRHEEPIINKPDEAFTTLRAGIVDAIVIGDHRIITRRQSVAQEGLARRHTNAA